MVDLDVGPPIAFASANKRLRPKQLDVLVRSAHHIQSDGEGYGPSGSRNRLEKLPRRLRERGYLCENRLLERASNPEFGAQDMARKTLDEEGTPVGLTRYVRCVRGPVTTQQFHRQFARSSEG